MLAASLGYERGWQNSDERTWLNNIDAIARVDRPGNIERDFQSVNAPTRAVAESRKHQILRNRPVTQTKITAADAAHWTIPNGAGGRWSVNKSTTDIGYRHYLADAEFIVAITHEDPERVLELADRTHNPLFVNYLGRKAFGPTFPYHLGTFDGDPRAVLSRLATNRTNHEQSATNTVSLPLHPIVGSRNNASERVSVPMTGSPLDAWAAARDNEPAAAKVNA
jgi:CRISPR system Cascade subunit CasD